MTTDCYAVANEYLNFYRMKLDAEADIAAANSQITTIQNTLVIIMQNTEDQNEIFYAEVRRLQRNLSVILSRKAIATDNYEYALSELHRVFNELKALGCV